MSKKQDGTVLFEQYYSNLYGDRWVALKSALLADKTTAVLQGFLTEDYHLDRASVVVAQALQVKPLMSVLDLCAAPGGKALVLAHALYGQGLLTVNERSTERFFRLKRNMEKLLSPYNQIINYTKLDATRYSFIQSRQYDAILVDAPCSSEEHLLKSPAHLSQWTLRRTKQLAITQVAILCQALTLCKTGGTILYATCALSPLENDDVIATLLKKRPQQFSIDPLTEALGEQTSYGHHILPDHYGMGPLYYCRLLKF